MFAYVPFCRRNVRLVILVALIVIVLIIVRHPLPFQRFIQIITFQTSNDLTTVVPNTVHFFHFIDNQQPNGTNNRNNVEDLNFVSATCILAAAFNQEPDHIIIHTNTNVTFNLANKKYWSLVFRVLQVPLQHDDDDDKNTLSRKTTKTILKVVHIKQPTHVFGQPLSSTFHAADVARLNVLIREGGIALDQDTFIVRKLDQAFFNQGPKVTLGKYYMCSMFNPKEVIY